VADLAACGACILSLDASASLAGVEVEEEAGHWHASRKHIESTRVNKRGCKWYRLSDDGKL
jgi:hypothetical protein